MGLGNVWRGEGGIFLFQIGRCDVIIEQRHCIESRRPALGTVGFP